MPSRDATPMPDAPTEELAAFDPPLAEAVAAVLTGAGVPAALDEAPGGERSVLVPAARRSEALAALASRMDEVQALAAGRPRGPAGAVGDGGEHAGAGDAGGEHAGAGDAGGQPPLVLERFRSFGWVAVALVPLLVIALARVRLPAGAMIALVVGSVVLLSAWRSGRLGREE